MKYLKALGYVSYIGELLALTVGARTLPLDVVAAQASDIVYRAVDQATKGQARRAIDREKLTSAVGTVVDVVVDVVR